MKNFFNRIPEIKCLIVPGSSQLNRMVFIEKCILKILEKFTHGILRKLFIQFLQKKNLKKSLRTRWKK